MEQGNTRITVCFEAPFWVCLFEREWKGWLEVSRIVFGAEPRDQEIYAWLLEHWQELRFSPQVKEAVRERRSNTRRRREAVAALQARGTGTKAQQALQLQREQEIQERREKRRRRDQAEEEHRFQLRREKKKAKHRGR